MSPSSKKPDNPDKEDLSHAGAEQPSDPQPREPDLEQVQTPDEKEKQGPEELRHKVTPEIPGGGIVDEVKSYGRATCGCTCNHKVDTVQSEQCSTCGRRVCPMCITVDGHCFSHGQGLQCGVLLLQGTEQETVRKREEASRKAHEKEVASRPPPVQ